MNLRHQIHKEANRTKALALIAQMAGFANRNKGNIAAVAAGPAWTAAEYAGANPMVDLRDAKPGIGEFATESLLHSLGFLGLRRVPGLVKGIRQGSNQARLAATLGSIVLPTPVIHHTKETLGDISQTMRNLNEGTGGLPRITSDLQRTGATLNGMLTGKEQRIPLPDGGEEVLPATVSIKNVVDAMNTAGEGVKGLGGALQFAPTAAGGLGGYFLGGKLADLFSSEKPGKATRHRASGQLLGALGGAGAGYALTHPDQVGAAVSSAGTGISELLSRAVASAQKLRG